jgi:flagellar hook assembly protein FlgD
MVSIRFRADGGEPLACRIYDLRGRLVRTVHAGEATGDWQTVQWDGRGEDGRAAPSGAYLVLLQAEQGARARRLTLAR